VLLMHRQIIERIDADGVPGVMLWHVNFRAGDTARAGLRRCRVQTRITFLRETMRQCQTWPSSADGCVVHRLRTGVALLMTSFLGSMR
jgi:hypothetical protein